MAAGKFFLVDETSREARGTLLLIGGGVLANSLTELLAREGVLVERATCEQGAPTVRALVPDLIVLAGDAAADRGKTMLAKLATDTPIATLVIAAPELGGLTVQLAPRHVAFLGLEGGTGECARRVRAVAELYFEEGLATCSLQQLADTVAPRVKPPVTRANTPASTTGSVAAAAAAVPSPAKVVTPPHGTAKLSPVVSAAKVSPSPVAQKSVAAAVVARPSSAQSSSSLAAAKPAVAPAKPPASSARSTATLSAAKPDVTPAKPPASSAQSTSALAAAKPAPAVQTPQKQPADLAAAAPKTLAEKAMAALDAQQAKRRAQANATESQPTTAAKPPATQPDTTATGDRAGAQPAKKVEPALSVAAVPQQTAQLSFVAAPASIAAEPSAVTAAPPPQYAPHAMYAAITPAPGVRMTSAASAGVSAVKQDVAVAWSEPALEAFDSEVVISVSEPAPHAKPAVIANTDTEISVSLSEPAPSTTAPNGSADDRAGTRRPAILRAPPTGSLPLQGDRETAGRCGTSEGRRTIGSSSASPAPANDLRTSAKDVKPELEVPRNARRPVLRSQRNTLQGAASVERKPTASVQQPAPQTVPDPEVATATRDLSAAPKLRRAGNPLAVPLASPAQPAAAKDPLSQLLAAHAAADSPPSVTYPRSKAWHALVYIAAIAACASLVILKLDLFSNKIDAVVALGSLQAGTSQLSHSTASNTRRTGAASQSASAQASRTPATKRAATAATSNRYPVEDALSFDQSGATHKPSAQDAKDDAEQLVDEGSLLFEDDRLGLAEASYLKALKVVPGYPRAMSGLVRVHIARKDGAEAVRWAKQLVAKQPKSGPHQLLLGDALALRGDMDAARAAWNRAVRYGSAAARQRLTP